MFALLFFLLYTLVKSYITTGCACYSLSFDGVDDFVQLSSPSCSELNPFALNTFTYEIWFFFADYKNLYQWVMGQGGDYGVRFHREGLTHNLAFVNANGKAECFQSLTCKDIPIQEWYHAAASFNGTHFFFVCNGTLPPENILNCTDKGYPDKWDVRWDLGQDHMQPNTRNGFGLYDEMRVWNVHVPVEELNSRRFRSLTSEERKWKNLSFYYSFDEGEGIKLKNDKLEKDFEMEGDIGGKEFRIEYAPKWVKSSCPVAGACCVIEAKIGGFEYLEYFPIYSNENDNLRDISFNFNEFSLTLRIKTLPEYGKLIIDDQELKKVDYVVKENSFIYISPLKNIEKNLSTKFEYCVAIDSNKNEICNYFSIKLTKNSVPFAGTAGTCLYFDGVDDYGFSESFVWLANNYKNGFGGGPITIEWWGLNTDTDFQIDNLLASGSSTFSIGSTEMAGYWCEEFCVGNKIKINIFDKNNENMSNNFK